MSSGFGPMALFDNDVGLQTKTAGTRPENRRSAKQKPVVKREAVRQCRSTEFRRKTNEMNVRTRGRIRRRHEERSASTINTRDGLSSLLFIYRISLSRRVRARANVEHYRLDGRHRKIRWSPRLAFLFHGTFRTDARALFEESRAPLDNPDRWADGRFSRRPGSSYKSAQQPCRDAGKLRGGTTSPDRGWWNGAAQPSRDAVHRQRSRHTDRTSRT